MNTGRRRIPSTSQSKAALGGKRRALLSVPLLAKPVACLATRVAWCLAIRVVACLATRVVACLATCVVACLATRVMKWKSCTTT